MELLCSTSVSKKINHAKYCYNTFESHYRVSNWNVCSLLQL